MLRVIGSVHIPFAAFFLSVGLSDDADNTRRWSSSSPIRPRVNLRVVYSFRRVHTVCIVCLPRKDTSGKDETCA